MENNNNTIDKDRQNLLVFIWKKRKTIIVTSSIAMLLSGVISFFITPLYLSTAIVFPTVTNTVSFSDQRNAMDFGAEEHAEQLIQILQSSRIRDRVINQFDLMNHYKIDKNDKNKYFKLISAYEGHISFTRTRYGSIQIDVLDEQPIMAAKIANTIVDLIDTVKNSMIAERTLPAFEINKRKKEILEKDLQNVFYQLDTLADQGVVSLDERANLFQAYVDSKSAEDRKFLKKQIDINLKYGSKFDALEQIRDGRINKLELFLVSYEQAESDANTNFIHKFIVEKAEVADKKEQPKRMIIILLTTVGTFFFTIFSLLILEKYKELKKIE